MAILTRKIFVISKTILFYLLFLTMGSIVAIPGPTITSIQENLKNDENLNLLFVSRPIGYIFGAIFGGFLLDSVKVKEPLLIVTSIAMGLLMIGIGFCDYAWKAYLIIYFAGMAIQTLNAGINICVLELWGYQTAGYYQALHFSFAVGGFLAPLIAKPFIEDKAPQSYPPSIVWAYVIVGCNAIFITIVFLLFTLYTRKEAKRYKPDRFISESATPTLVARPAHIYIILSMACVLIAAFFALAIEISYSQCVATYAIKGYLVMSKQEASYMTAAFWAPYMVSRLVAIFVTNRVNVSIVVFVSCLFLIIAGFVLVFADYRNEAALWIGTIFVGWGCGPLFPAMVTWLSKYVEVTFVIGSMLFTAGTLSEMTIPHILLENADAEPRLLGYLVLIASILASFFYFLLWRAFVYIQNRYHRVTSSLRPPPPFIMFRLPIADINQITTAEVTVKQLPSDSTRNDKKSPNIGRRLSPTSSSVADILSAQSDETAQRSDTQNSLEYDETAQQSDTRSSLEYDETAQRSDAHNDEITVGQTNNFAEETRKAKNEYEAEKAVKDYQEEEK